MIRKYRFDSEEPFEFDDSKTVKELVEYAFEKFDYYEPFGMNTVTVFQCSHSGSNEGWFTTDTSRRCADEIEDCENLCFAYNIPRDFYYAEGGWGHHMKSLGNHPILQNPVSLKLKFDDFVNTIVFRGTMTFNEVIDRFVKAGYIERPDRITVKMPSLQNSTYSTYISIDDEIIGAPLTEFEASLPPEIIIKLD